MISMDMVFWYYYHMSSKLKSCYLTPAKLIIGNMVGQVSVQLRHILLSSKPCDNVSPNFQEEEEEKVIIFQAWDSQS